MNFNDREDTFFQVKKTLNCRGHLLDLSTPALMGILNITPDSFYAGGKWMLEESVLSAAESMLMEGADILDIGGQSTRPGASIITREEEWARISSPLKLMVKQFPEAIISVDTFYADVAEKAVDTGASIVNDISAGEMDEDMFSFIAKSKVPYVLMHKKGTPQTMQQDPQYTNVLEEVCHFFAAKIHTLKELGVYDIILDPGFGFGKTVTHNYTLLKNLHVLKIFDCPVMAGISRKSMITRVLNIQPTDALTGTIALNTLALINGASILRVHDVAEAVEVKKLMNQYLLTD